MVRLLFIGDVVKQPGVLAVERVLSKFRKEHGISLVVANGENSADRNGMSKESITSLFKSGVDILTGGNHSFRDYSAFEFLNGNEFVLRPANISSSGPGKGFCIYRLNDFSVAVINLLGQVYIDANTSPFEEINRLLKKIDTKLILVDFHAEATGEKGALAHYLNGKVSAVVGTHTHVQTNDARILDKGTGFITDVGMVGPYFDSVLGVSAKCVIRRMITKLPTKFEFATGACIFNAVIISIDELTGRCEKIEPISFEC